MTVFSKKGTNSALMSTKLKGSAQLGNRILTPMRNESSNKVDDEVQHISTEYHNDEFIERQGSYDLGSSK
jgi:hypothetical protein